MCCCLLIAYSLHIYLLCFLLFVLFLSSIASSFPLVPLLLLVVFDLVHFLVCAISFRYCIFRLCFDILFEILFYYLDLLFLCIRCRRHVLGIL